MKSVKTITYWVVSILVIIFALFVIFTTLPIPGNFKLYVVRSGSMEPAIKTGSLIVIKPADDYHIGEIVTFLPRDAKKKNEVVTHRIVEILDEEGRKSIITKGDANSSNDPIPTPFDNIKGRLVFKIPYFGYPIGFARTMPGLIILIIIPGTVIIYSEIQNIAKEIKKRRTSRQARDKKKKGKK